MPEKKKVQKKYSCPDCTFCQWCADTRCGRCRPPGRDCGKPKKPHKPVADHK